MNRSEPTGDTETPLDEREPGFLIRPGDLLMAEMGTSPVRGFGALWMGTLLWNQVQTVKSMGEGVLLEMKTSELETFVETFLRQQDLWDQVTQLWEALMRRQMAERIIGFRPEGLGIPEPGSGAD